MNDTQENFQYTDFDGHFKDPIVYDDVKLKQMSCSHIEQAKYISQNGNETIRCKACGKWDYE